MLIRISQNAGLDNWFAAIDDQSARVELAFFAREAILIMNRKLIKIRRIKRIKRNDINTICQV
jgi:hypothetical protein